MSRMRRGNGFTLVEILIVLVVICILATILLPVFARVREKAQRATCQSNLKQIGLATQLYINDNDDLFPLSGVGHFPYFWPSNILSYAGNRQIFECPTFKGYFESYALGSHYLYDALRLNYSPPGSRGWLPRHESRISEPTRVWLVRDTSFTSDYQLVNDCGGYGMWPRVHMVCSP